MLFFIREAFCDANEFNTTFAYHDQHLDGERFLLTIVCPISILALLANALSLFVFARQKWDNQAIRFVLMSVSFWEVFLQIFILLKVFMVLSGTQHFHNVYSYFFTSLFHLVINASTSIRNWNIVILSLSRCELVCYPVRSRVHLTLTLRRLRVLLAILVMVAFCLSTLVQLEYVGVICEELDSGISDAYQSNIVIRPFMPVRNLGFPQSNLNVTESLRGQYPGTPSLLLYAFQSLLPIIVIPFPTLVMIFKLNQARRMTKKLQTINCANKNHGDVMTTSLQLVPLEAGTSQALDSLEPQERLLTRSQHHSCIRQRSGVGSWRTSSLVLTLVFAFCILETPTFLSSLLYCFPRIQNLLHMVYTITIYSNVFTVVDSLINFFVYAAASSTFRSETKKALLCKKSQQRTFYFLRTPKASTVVPPNRLNLAGMHNHNSPFPDVSING